MIFHIILGFVFVGVSQSKSTGEIQAWFVEHAMECNSKHPISGEEMIMMKNHKLPNSDAAKCLLACVMKKTNFINDKGIFDEEKANEWAAKEFTDDSTKIDNAKIIHDICKKVNDEPVGDGEKGCDRALQLTKCLMENGPKHGFPIEPVH